MCGASGAPRSPGPSAPPRSGTLNAMPTRREGLLEELRARPSGLAWARRHTDLVDAAVRAACEEVGVAGPDANLAVVATGGYGRRELSPWSDVDVTVVPLDDAAPDLDAGVRALYRALNVAVGDELGLELGYAYRLASDAPGLDATTQTGLLDARLVAGSPRALAALEEALAASFAPAEFLLAKLDERAATLARHGDTPSVTEPNLKEGAGGLRALHFENWVRYALGERARAPDADFERVLLARNLLHLVAGRRHDVLTRARQGEIAAILGEGLELWTSATLRAMRGLDAASRRAAGRIARAEFPLGAGAVAQGGEARPIPGADAARCAVGLALAHRLGLGVSELPVAVAPTRDGPALLYAFSRGEGALRAFDRCGLLASLLPELDAVRDLVPGDGIHRYTVMEHSLRAVRVLDETTDAFLDELQSSLPDRGTLVLALLLHDVGKISPGRSHALYGAEIAAEVCERLGIPPEAAGTIVWLVREHLEMVRFLRLRDVGDPATVAEFVRLVGTRERLDALTLLTYADVNAVADGVWTPAQDAYLRELHARAADALAADAPPEPPDPAVVRRRVTRRLSSDAGSAGPNADPADLDAFVDSLPAHYLVSTPPDVIALHRGFVARAEGGEPTIELYPRPELGLTEFTVCALDRPNLLGDLLAAFYAYDLSVSGLRVLTTRGGMAGDPPVALDVFSVSHGGGSVPSATAASVAGAIGRLLRGELAAETLLRDRGKDPERRAAVLSWSLAPAGRPGDPAILEVRSPRGRGLPYRLARWIAAQGWSVTAARLGQWGGNVAAAFSIDRPAGLASEAVEAAVRSLREEG